MQLLGWREVGDILYCDVTVWYDTPNWSQGTAYLPWSDGCSGKVRRESESCHFEMEHEFILLKRLTSWYFLSRKVDMELLQERVTPDKTISESVILNTWSRAAFTGDTWKQGTLRHLPEQISPFALHCEMDFHVNDFNPRDFWLCLRQSHFLQWGVTKLWLRKCHKRVSHAAAEDMQNKLRGLLLSCFSNEKEGRANCTYLTS